MAGKQDRKGNQALIEARRAQVMQHLLGRKAYRDIAQVVGIGLGTVCRDVQSVIARWQEEQRDAITEHKALELQANAAAIGAVWAQVLTGDPVAIRSYLGLAEQRHKMLGLYSQHVDVHVEGRVVRLPAKARSVEEWQAENAAYIASTQKERTYGTTAL